jgi:hypothetical protein
MAGSFHSHFQENTMPKGQERSNREKKKPKKPVAPVVPGKK